ncbi:MAG TPA: diiron oxygenase [Candidatus Dormibacteraeota bacterium]|nr:diiron oxygenase [Candidatus Dormibacteraeota bacterium]
MPEEEPEAPDAFASLVERLNRQSVLKHFEAYVDVPWDDDDYRIDAGDPRWELSPDDALGATEWYRSLPQAQRARLGLETVASKMKIGLVFEGVLKRGLLEFAAGLPNGSPEFRYAYHEVIEEAQHSLMFQEFVNRSGFDARGLGRVDRSITRWIVSLGRRFPALFFVFVLGGEDPIDYVQRRELRSARSIHPLLERIMRIHVTEEARHLSFARHYLENTVPRLGPFRRAALAVGAPLILSGMAQMMLRPSRQLVRRHAIPRSVIKEAFLHNPAHRAEMLASMAKLRRLFAELGLASGPYRRLWQVLGLWPSGRGEGDVPLGRQPARP